MDFTPVFMGPSCTQLLGDYGADIIKVERPGAGDISRNSFPDKDGQDNPIFLSINLATSALMNWYNHRVALVRR